METENIALNLAKKEAIYIRIFRRNLLMVPFIERLVIISDNTIAITKDMKCHSKAKHIEGKYYYVSDMLKNKKFGLKGCQRSKIYFLLDVIAILNKKLEFHWVMCGHCYIITGFIRVHCCLFFSLVWTPVWCFFGLPRLGRWFLNFYICNFYNVYLDRIPRHTYSMIPTYS